MTSTVIARPWISPVALWTLLLAGLVVGLFLASVAVGAVPLDLHTVVSGLAGTGDTATVLILREIRLPRALLAVVVGASLGMAGAALQGLLRNPLADPGVIGISGGAGLGSVAVFYSGLSVGAGWLLPVGGMAGALAAMLLLRALAGREAGLLTLILAGVTIGQLSNALISLALNMAPSPFAVSEIVFWLLGSLTDRSMVHVALAVPPILVGLALLLSTTRALDALTLGEDAARSLGFPIGPVQARVVLGTTLAVGAAVSVTGGIGFVGLVVPHLIRRLTGYRHGALLPLAGLGGAALVLAADLVVRLVPTPNELKLGVVTALIGAPFFLALVLRYRHEIA